MNSMDIFAIFGGIALVIGDLLALFSLLGSALVFITGVISFTQRRHIRFSGQALQWSFMGLIFGAVGQFGLQAMPRETDLEGMFIRMPIKTANFLLVLSFCLLCLGFLMRRASENQVGYIAPIPRRRVSTRRNLASGKEFNQPVTRYQNNTPEPRERKKAVTIPNEDIEKEVAWVLSTLYPVKARVDNPPKGKVNIKLYDGQGSLVGVVQVSQDPEDRFLPPTVLSTLNSYKSKSHVPKAFFVTTGMFRDDTSAQAKDMGINLVDGPLLDAWRKRARAKTTIGNNR